MLEYYLVSVIIEDIVILHFSSDHSRIYRVIIDLRREILTKGRCYIMQIRIWTSNLVQSKTNYNQVRLICFALIIYFVLKTLILINQQ